MIFARNRSVEPEAEHDNPVDVTSGDEEMPPAPYLPDFHDERNESLHTDC
jgi:hypothetical protein